MKNTFYDIHMHAMDLSHPNLVAFLDRLSDLKLGGYLAGAGLAASLRLKGLRNFVNLLAVMENCIDDFFCLMEYYLTLGKDPLLKDGPLKVGDQEYDRIVLTPLIMDFGYKDMRNEEIFYDKPTGKPVAEQTADILRAIAKYCEFRIEDDSDTENKRGIKFVRRDPSAARLFEIYPFLGVNPGNYGLKEFQDLITRLFGGYTGKRADLLANMGLFGKIEAETADFRDALASVKSSVFAGIKLYPPLGFDPWPSTDEEELLKVKFLYGLCAEKGIPVTVHCSDGGFATVKNPKKFTAPSKWAKVLKEGGFSNLKLNFAHFGSQDDDLDLDGWCGEIIRLALDGSHPNIYADISCLATKPKFYDDLRAKLKKHPQMWERTLFGSDFMINLIWSDSYTDYLRSFQTATLDPVLKHKLCSENPARFLFG